MCLGSFIYSVCAFVCRFLHVVRAPEKWVNIKTTRLAFVCAIFNVRYVCFMCCYCCLVICVLLLLFVLLLLVDVVLSSLCATFFSHSYISMFIFLLHWTALFLFSSRLCVRARTVVFFCACLFVSTSCSFIHSNVRCMLYTISLALSNLFSMVSFITYASPCAPYTTDNIYTYLPYINYSLKSRYESHRTLHTAHRPPYTVHHTRRNTCKLHFIPCIPILCISHSATVLLWLSHYAKLNIMYCW